MIPLENDSEPECLETYTPILKILFKIKKTEVKIYFDEMGFENMKSIQLIPIPAI